MAWDSLTRTSAIDEQRILVVHDAGLPELETEAINRQTRTGLEPLGFVVEIAADTSEASERLRSGNYALLIANVLSFATCTDAMAQVLDALREEPDRPEPGTLLMGRRWSDVIPATVYQRTNALFMVALFNPAELRAFVRRLLEQPDLRRNASASD